MTKKTEGISLSGITGSQIVINSRDVTQTIEKDYGTAAAKTFQSLFDELSNATSALAQSHKDEAQRVQKATEPLLDELSKEKKSPGYLQITLDGLRAAASTVKDIAPGIVETVSKIIELVNSIIIN